MRRMLLLAALLFLSHMGFAATLAEYTFENPQKHEEFRTLIEEMRCLVCQNESLAGSNAELAVDLRNEIYDMMKAGQNKDQIIEFMVDRYGDFVLYSPPIKPSTYPIWFGPVILFFIGAIFLITILRKKSRSRETKLSTEEQQRLDALLNASTDSRKADQ